MGEARQVRSVRSLGVPLQPYLTLVLPNLLFTAAIFFALPAMTRQMVPNYVGGVLLLLGYLMGGSAAQRPHRQAHWGAARSVRTARDAGAHAILVDRRQECALRAALGRAGVESR